MSEHSGITVDVPNALNDQTGQGHSQHSELKTSSLPPPLGPLFIGDQRRQPTLEKISQNGGGVKTLAVISWISLTAFLIIREEENFVE